MTPEGPKQRARRILQDVVAAKLKGPGFKKKKDVLVRELDDIAHLVDIQNSRRNDAQHVSFTLNCGVWMRGVTSAFRNAPDPAEPRPSDQCLGARVGMLTESQLDRWWDLKSDDPVGHDDLVHRDLGAMIDEVVLPFLGRFQTGKDVAEFLSLPLGPGNELIDPRAPGLRAAYAAAAWSALSMPERCRELLERAVVLGNETPLEETIGEFARRLAR